RAKVEIEVTAVVPA
ncbi:hypothetical protein, partial [Delftia tsuruhatensis]